MVSYGIRRALNEVRHILENQWKNGMLPQIRFLEDQWDRVCMLRNMG